MITESSVEMLTHKFEALRGEMDERARRLWAACEAQSLGRGGITAVANATGLAVETVRAGLRELSACSLPTSPPGVPLRRVRRVGAGRKTIAAQNPEVLRALDALLDSTTRGDPMAPLRWTCKSTRVLAEELQKQGRAISDRSVAAYLKDKGYSLQANRKTREGTSHPDRNAQFEHIGAQVKAFQQRGQPVISVDTKKKELIGDFKNGGREWRPQGQPQEVRTHDFEDKQLGKAIPYGVYDVTGNTGWVSVGIDHDTAEFAVQAIRQWWQQMGSRSYADATELLITADGGGSNGSRLRLWKVALQKFADETGLRVTVCHFPPGTSKWNKIEHRMFCHITRNWRGRPLESLDVIVNLIGATKTENGLKIKAALDTGKYPTGTKVSNKELAEVQIKRNGFHGEWNYAIVPRSKITLAKVVTS